MSTAQSPASVEVRDLVKRFGDTVALDGVSLDVRPGELFGVIGPDGAGKSTLFRILVSILLPDAGSATIDGLDVVADYRELRTRLGYMPGKFSLYQDLTVRENLEFFASVFGTTVEAEYDLIAPIYSQIEPFANRRAGALSGGMKQKLALSCALVHRPRVLVLDEPTTGVDAVSRAEFWDMLSGLTASGITTIVSTAYMDEAARCDRIALMQEGRFLREPDTPEVVAKSIAAPLIQVDAGGGRAALLAGLRGMKGVSRADVFGEWVHVTGADESGSAERLAHEVRASLESSGFADVRVGPTTTTVEDVFMSLMDESVVGGSVDGSPVDGGQWAVDGSATGAATESDAEGTNETTVRTRSIVSGRTKASGGTDSATDPRCSDDPVAETPTVHRPPPTDTPYTEEPAVWAKGLTRTFGDFTAVDDITFSVAKGEVFGFLGANGAGKTTAMKMLTGLLAPSAGRAETAGFDISADPEGVKKRIGYMSQRFALYDDLTVTENIRFFGGVYGLTNRQIKDRTASTLARLGFEGMARERVGRLPLGWKQKLAFSVALLHEPEVVFLDEPTGGVDPVTRRQFWEMIYDAAARGTTVFVTTHYMDEAEYCDRVSIMVAGKIAAMGTPGELKAQFNASTMDEVFVKLVRPEAGVAVTSVLDGDSGAVDGGQRTVDGDSTGAAAPNETPVRTRPLVPGRMESPIRTDGSTDPKSGAAALGEMPRHPADTINRVPTDAKGAPSRYAQTPDRPPPIVHRPPSTDSPKQAPGSAFFSFVRKEARHILRDRQTLAVLILMPVAMVLLFGYAIRTDVEDVKLLVVDGSHDARSADLTRALASTKALRLVGVTQGAVNVEPALRVGEAYVALIIPPDFARSFQRGTAEVMIVSDGANANYAASAEAYVRTVVQQWSAQNGAGAPIVRVAVRMRFNPTLASQNLFVPGLLAFVLILVSALMTAISISKEKETGSLEVLLVSPLRPLQIILGKVAPYLVLAFLNAVTALGVAWLVFGVPVNGSLPLLLGASLIYVLGALALGVLISAKSPDQRTAMMSVLLGLLIPTLAISGFIFPIASMPEWIQPLTRIVPATWFIIVARGIMLKGAGIAVLWKEIAVLVGMAVVLLAAGSRAFKDRVG